MIVTTQQWLGSLSLCGPVVVMITATDQWNFSPMLIKSSVEFLMHLLSFSLHHIFKIFTIFFHSFLHFLHFLLNDVKYSIDSNWSILLECKCWHNQGQWLELVTFFDLLMLPGHKCISTMVIGKTDNLLNTHNFHLISFGPQIEFCVHGTIFVSNCIELAVLLDWDKFCRGREMLGVA